MKKLAATGLALALLATTLTLFLEEQMKGN